MKLLLIFISLASVLLSSLAAFVKGGAADVLSVDAALASLNLQVRLDDNNIISSSSSSISGGNSNSNSNNNSSSSSSSSSSNLIDENIIKRNNVNIHVNSGGAGSSRSVKKLDQAEVDLLLNGAKDKLRVGLLEESIPVLIEVLEQDTDHFEANRLLGSVLLSLQRYKMAESLLYTAVKVSNWSDLNSIGNLAECLRLSNELDLALKVASRGINIELKNEYERGEHGFLRFVLGSIYFNKAEYTMSAEWYLSSALMQVGYIEAWIRASTLRFPSEHINKLTAINVLTVAVRQNPQNVMLLHKLGEALLLNDMAADAVVILQSALAQDPDGQIADSRSYLANALIILGRVEEANSLYQASSPMFEFDVLGFQSLHHILQMDGNIDAYI